MAHFVLPVLWGTLWERWSRGALRRTEGADTAERSGPIKARTRSSSVTQICRPLHAQPPSQHPFPPPPQTDHCETSTHTSLDYIYTTHNLLPRSGPGRFPSQVKHTSDTTLATFSCQLHAEDYWRWYSPKYFWFLSSTSVNWISYFRRHRSPFLKNSSIIWKTTDRLFNHENNRPPLDVQTDVVNRTLTRSAVNVLWLGNKMTKERLIKLPTGDFHSSPVRAQTGSGCWLVC